MPIAYKIVNVDAPEVEQYLQIRTAVFAHIGNPPLYSNGLADENDQREGTKFLLSIEDGKVTGGLRFIFRVNLRGEELPFENNDQQLNAAKLLPQLDLGELTYCEIGALAVLPERIKSGRNLTQKTIELALSGDEIAADIFIVDSRPLVFAQQARIGAGMVTNGVIRTDVELTYNGGNKCHALMFSANDNLLLATDDMIQSGALPNSKPEQTMDWVRKLHLDFKQNQR